MVKEMLGCAGLKSFGSGVFACKGQASERPSIKGHKTMSCMKQTPGKEALLQGFCILQF